MTEPFREEGITAVVGAEARAFILGSVCAVALGTGFVPARKLGSVHPGEKVVVTSEPDWRGRRSTFRLAKVLGKSDRVLIVDDWIETGSQASAIAGAVAQMGAEVIGVSVLVNQAPAATRSRLNVIGLVDYDELPDDTQH
ncbi:MAG: phosphoribosyltransferase [Acidimicrobiia bacterium]|nr:phosphoribosyltransferase [Acidimicrobiia bacterium]